VRNHEELDAVGRHVVEILEAAGHEVVAASRSTGVDVITGAGLAEALAGADCVVDAATGPTPDEQAATEFFTTSARNLQELGARAGVRRIVVVSIHWGGNWGYDVPREHVDFAHALIAAGASIVHGHSSHHVRPIEVHRGGLILYGCGDFLTDYEGIGQRPGFRDDLVVMYFPVVDGSRGALTSLQLAPLQIRRFRLERPSADDARWLRDTLDRISKPFGTRVGGGDRRWTTTWT